jgi:alkyl hydroperoxide reductase subunit AhpC
MPLISDLSRDMARDFGVLCDDPVDGDCGVAFRGTFVIDPAGVVRSVAINDLPVGRSVDEVLRIVQAFQHHDKHGDVCPAGWTPGKKTMVADPKRAQEYFSTIKDLK